MITTGQPETPKEPIRFVFDIYLKYAQWYEVIIVLEEGVCLNYRPKLLQVSV